MSNLKHLYRAGNTMLNGLGPRFEGIFSNPDCRRRFSVQNPSRMRYVQYTCKQNRPQMLGVQLESSGDVIEVSAVDAAVPNNFMDFLKGGQSLWKRAKRIVGEGKSVMCSDNVVILPPISKPDKVLCVGLNYKSHCDEQKVKYPEEPMFFAKFPSTIIGHNGEVKHPPNTRALDWEVELAVVIGKQCRCVTDDEANDHIFGYTIAQDISARDWQTRKKNGGQWLFAKSMDTFCPLGPAIVPKEFIGDPRDLQVSCHVNGVRRQFCNTSDMVHDVFHIVSYLSHCITLLPGDVILTGTPAGVGLFAQPTQFLKEGDIIESEISHIGKLFNTISK